MILLTLEQMPVCQSWLPKHLSTVISHSMSQERAMSLISIC